MHSHAETSVFTQFSHTHKKKISRLFTQKRASSHRKRQSRERTIQANREGNKFLRETGLPDNNASSVHSNIVLLDCRQPAGVLPWKRSMENVAAHFLIKTHSVCAIWGQWPACRAKTHSCRTQHEIYYTKTANRIRS